MKRFPWLALSWWAVPLIVCSACQSPRVVRESEMRRAVRFESEQARQVFLARVDAEMSRKTETKSRFGQNSSAEVLSDSAIYNDQVAACDANRDDFITLEELKTHNPKTASREQPFAR